MTRDEIIKLAREAGMPSLSLIDIGYLEKFAALVAAAECEECAKVCDEQAQRSEASMLKAKSSKARDVYSGAGQTAMWMATAIRARSQASTARMCPSTYYECQRGCGEGGCKDFEEAHQRSQA